MFDYFWNCDTQDFLFLFLHPWNTQHTMQRWGQRHDFFVSSVERQINKKSLLLRLSIHLYTLDWSRGDPNGWPAWYWLGSQSRTPCSTLAWQADSYLTTLGFPSKCIPHIERAEWRKHNNLLRSGHQLARIIEKTIRNRISSTRYFEKPKMRGLLQKWFATRLSTA